MNSPNPRGWWIPHGAPYKRGPGVGGGKQQLRTPGFQMLRALRWFHVIGGDGVQASAGRESRWCAELDCNSVCELCRAGDERQVKRSCVEGAHVSGDGCKFVAAVALQLLNMRRAQICRRSCMLCSWSDLALKCVAQSLARHRFCSSCKEQVAREFGDACACGDLQGRPKSALRNLLLSYHSRNPVSELSGHWTPKVRRKIPKGHYFAHFWRPRMEP